MEFTPAQHVELADRLAHFPRRPAAVPGGVRAAAVAICIVGDGTGDACYVLTRRAVGLRTHARQWALPGGRLEAGEDAVAGARRELREEIGLDPGHGAVLGLLDDYVTRSGFAITPVVLWCDGDEEPVANPAEVESIHRFSIAALADPTNPRLLTIPESDRPVIQLQLAPGTLLHAPTAAVLFQLSEIATYGRVTRVDHFDQPLWAWR